MSSVDHDPAKVPAEDLLDRTPTPNSQPLEKHTAAEDIFESQVVQYPAPLALFLLMLAICTSIFLVALDRTIITTAIPHITDQFHSYNDVGWYASAHLITACSFLPTYGRLYGMLDTKWLFLSGLFLFELGSLICGVAPTSKVLIVGRAVARTGSARILTGSSVVVTISSPLQKRPLYAGVVGMMFGVGAIAGPILGGAFTDRATWRWCFYFNLPLGGLIAAATMFFFKLRDEHTSPPIMFFLAMQYNAQPHAWDTSRVIGLLVGAAGGLILFIIWQWREGERALIPPSIMLQRSVAAGCINTFFVYATLLAQVYYLPVWFQACGDKSALGSGVNMIPYMLGSSLFAILTGAFVSRIGYFTPPTIVGCAIATIGSGLLSTLAINTGSSRWIGYEVLVSIGLGMANQQGYIAVQCILSLDQIAVGSALVSAFQSLGGAISVCVGNAVLLNELYDAVLPGVDNNAVIAAGATGFRTFLPKEKLPVLLNVHNQALRKVFLMGIVFSGLAFFAALGLEWRSVKGKEGDSEALKDQSEQGSQGVKVLDCSA